MDKINLSIAKDFSTTPGPRSKIEGSFSAEEFLEVLLIPKFEQALAEEKVLLIDLDGTAGYATSFLEGSFGELVRLKSKKTVEKHIQFISTEEPYLIDEISQYIRNAE